jgi:hypothetical protein
MINVLLQKIKELESHIEEIQTKNQKAKEIILDLFKDCKVSKDKKEMFKKTLLKALSNLETGKIKKFYDNNNALKYDSFLEIAKNINQGFLVIIDGNINEERKKFILGFLINKISPFFTISGDKIIGILDDLQLKEIRNLNSVPYFNPQTNDFSEIEIYKVIFDTDLFDLNVIEKAKKIFEELRIRPSYKNKRYIEYSLKTNKITDFEEEKLSKEKRKFSYIYDEKYPNLEVMLKREIKNIPFVLALLERIDNEMDQIKEYKGIQNIVSRMLNFIELNLPEESILDEVKFLRQRLTT